MCGVFYSFMVAEETQLQLHICIGFTYFTIYQNSIRSTVYIFGPSLPLYCLMSSNYPQSVHLFKNVPLIFPVFLSLGFSRGTR